MPGCAKCAMNGDKYTCETCYDGFYKNIDSTTKIASCLSCNPKIPNSLLCYKDDNGSTLENPVPT